MPYLSDSTQIPALYSSDLAGRDPVLSLDPRVQLQNLSEVRARMDSLHGFLSKSISSNAPLSKDQIDTVDSEIASAIQQVVASGTALMASSRGPDPPGRNPFPVPKLEEEEEEEAAAAKIGDEEEEKEGEMEIVELDSVELLAEHVHLCEICGKGFKRDANLRMHMRAHGNRFKTREALAKPNRLWSEPSGSRIRFSCPFPGCNRNKGHRKFRALKSAVCVRNHFKRSHCPKMFACNRCNRKSFSVLADLKTHLKHCGEATWRCSCGTSFSRKDKLFGHIALFDGHLPAVIDENDKPSKSTSAQNDEDEEAAPVKAVGDSSCANLLDDDEEFFRSLLNGFDSVQGFCLPDDLWSS